MKKDIFIDTNIACRFTNPMDPEMKKLISWIMKYDENSQDNAVLLVSNKLLHEYLASCKSANGVTSIPIIVNKLTQEGRLMKTSNADIKDFQRQYFIRVFQFNIPIIPDSRFWPWAGGLSFWSSSWLWRRRPERSRRGC